MDETCNHNQSGFLLISSLFILTTMIIIVSFYLSAVLLEVKVAQIIDTTPQAYYLAESGIQEAFWKLQNDAAYKTNFETDPNWSTSFTRNDSLVSGGSYNVSIQNQDIARAIITATSTISVRDTQAQRVVEVGVFKAINDDPITATTLIANNDIKGIGSNVSVTGGEIFANDDIDLAFFSTWSTDQTAKAVHEVDVSVSSNLTATLGIFDEDNPPIPSTILIPEIDFDSTATSSYKSLANQVYTRSEFRNLLKNFPITTLNGITYVTGSIYIKKGQLLTINGALVADGSIGVGSGFSFSGTPATLIVNKVGDDPSGLISKKNITIGGFSSDVDINGLVYAGGNFIITDGIWENVDTDIEGAVIAQDIKILMSWDPTTMLLNEAYILDALGEPLFSQILFINHWEEEF
ncbi:MAG: hypothetical protein QF747_02345 [Patescibacteria group bacterium]|jgi:hypothetical protein|nr:hypothetical protein [Patescibacteria group bacterium]MDP6756308.1 hypothetical protein [Patescibacteria group bacterium]|tara:strand:+ start:64081 stop:65301 length:1221 start_codon:yes stop_codon:yes gene_type:complete